MQIKYVDDSHVELEEENLNIQFDFVNEQLVLPEVIRTEPITSPGEYEYSDVTLMILEDRKLRTGKANLFKLSMEGVQVLILGSDITDIQNDLWEELGTVNVLVMNAIEGGSDISKLVNQINPAVLLALVGKRKVDVAKLTGMEAAETNKKFKFAAKDFQEEEPTTKLSVLA